MSKVMRPTDKDTSTRPIVAIVGATASGKNQAAQAAAAETGDLLAGELIVGTGVLALRNVEMAPKGLVEDRGAVHVAGRPDTGLDDVFPDRVMAKLRVKGRNARDRIGRDFRDLGQPFQGRCRQPVPLLLNCLEQRDQILGALPDPRHHLVDQRQVDLRRRL